MGNGYKVTGSNGNSIILPAAGYRFCDGDVHYVSAAGNYWSSAPSYSDQAWHLIFDSDRGTWTMVFAAAGNPCV